MNRRFQFSFASLSIASIALSFAMGWRSDGLLLGFACAIGAFYAMATVLAVATARHSRRELRSGLAVLEIATTKSELWLSPLHLIEAFLILAFAICVYLILDGAAIAIAIASLCTILAILKITVFVHCCSQFLRA